MKNFNLKYTILENDGNSSIIDEEINIEESSCGQVIALKIENKKKFIENFFHCIKQGHSPLVINPYVSQIDALTFAKIKNASFLITDEQTFQLDMSDEGPLRIMTCSSGTTSKDGEIKSFEFDIKKSLKNSEAHDKSLEIEKTSNILFPLPLNHSFGTVIGMLGSTANNHHLITFEKSPTNDQILDAISKFEIDILYLTPSLLRLLNKYLKRKKSIYPKQIKISIGASHLFASDLKEIKTYFPNAKLYYTYGLSEMGPRVSTYKIPDDILSIPTLSGLLPIGECIEDVWMRVEDGKLLIKSQYAHNQITNQEIDSNDEAKLINDQIYILGRSDHTINYAGVNIYPEEIESLITQVIPMEFIIGPKQSKLYGQVPILIVESSEDHTTLLDVIAPLIPSYIQINEVQALAKFPRTSMGKIKRQEILKLLDLKQ